MTPKRTFLASINLRFASFYLILVLVFYGLFSLFHLERNYRHLLLPDIKVSSKIVVVAIDEKSLNELGSWPWSRDLLADAMTKILDSQPQKLGVDILFQQNKQNSAKLDKVLSDSRVTVASQVSLVQTTPVIDVVNTAKQTGYANFPVDEDGVVRRAITKQNDKLSLTREVYGNGGVPQSFLLNTKTQLPSTVSMADIWEKPEVRSFLKDKIVLFGSTVLSLGDTHTIPNFGLVPGIYLHALALNQMLQGHYPQLSSLNSFDEILLVFIFALSWGWVSQSFKWNSYIYGVFLSIVFIIFALFPNINPRFSLEYLTANVLGLLATAIGIYMLNNYFEKTKLQKTLGLYVPAKVLQMIYKKPDIINLGGEMKKVTLMFTDIRNFTKMTEKFGKTNEFGIFLNSILDLQTRFIQANDGVVDKFIGDAVMAFWGAPVATDSDSYSALLAGCQIYRGLEEFNKTQGHELKIGIGISTGHAIVGNFGSSKRFNYTAIGDVVNTSSRIESLNKTYGTTILVGKPTIDSLSDQDRLKFVFGEVDQVCPKGKSKSIVLYEILSYLDQSTGNWLNLGEAYKFETDYNSALKFYYAGNFKKAKQLFTKIDLPKAKTMLARCEKLIDVEVENWSGVWNFETK